MKKLLPLCALLTGMFLTVSSCTNEENPGTPNAVPQSIVELFQNDFPNAQNVTWNSTDGEHYTASFSTPEGNNTAWYSKDGNRDMYHYEIPFSSLPEKVLAAFNESTYGQQNSGWTPDREVDVLERLGVETLYVIEVKDAKNNEIELYYNQDGILIKEIADSGNRYDDYLPEEPAGSIQDWLNASKYKNASIVDIENEDNGTEVELIYDNKKVEVLFDRNQQWLYTKTEYGRYQQNEVPANILEAAKLSDYWQQGYNRVEDIDFYETKESGNYYSIELEGRFDDEVKVYVNENGQLMENQHPNPGGNGNQGGGAAVETDLQVFIETNYPGARILEKEYDHGLLEIEIWHDNREKTVKFNGNNEWVSTDWEVRVNELPAPVTAAIDNGYVLDDNEADYVITPNSEWYEVEVRQAGRELKLHIAPDGNILHTEYDD